MACLELPTQNFDQEPRDEANIGRESYLLGDEQVLLDVAPGDVFVEGAPIKRLWPKEMEVFTNLARNADRTVEFDNLGEDFWTRDFEGVKNFAKVCVSGIRKKVGPKYGNATNGVIVAVRGKGYMAKTSIVPPKEIIIPSHSLADGRVLGDESGTLLVDNKVPQKLKESSRAMLLAFTLNPGVVLTPPDVRDEMFRLGSEITVDYVRPLLNYTRNGLGRHDLGDIDNGVIATIQRQGYMGRITLTNN